MTLRPVLAVLASAAACLALHGQSTPSSLPYRNPDLPLEERVDDLVSRLTLPEKAGLMQNDAIEVRRLGIPKYDWWNEALHGVARAGEATVFPQAIGLAAMWDDAFLQTIAGAIGVEARAKYHDAIRRGVHERYYGLTFWSPNINIFRDPRWGRGQETYGEDPYLTSRLGVAFVRGLQGDNPRYLQAAACAKHFAVHSGPEPLRHAFDVDPSEGDLRDTYLPAFEALVREARVESVMTAYNAVHGKPCAINDRLYSLLRDEWGFDGHVVSDCGAIYDLFHSYRAAAGAAQAEALAKQAGLSLTCGSESPGLVEAVASGLITEREIDQRLHELLRTWFRLGLFDPADRVPYAAIPFSENNSPAHARLALQAAEKSLVLLKNEGVLPLDRSRLRRVAVIGPNADSLGVLLGNYNGTPTAPVKILDGLKEALGPGVSVAYAKGCDYVGAGSGWQPIPAPALRHGRFNALQGEFFDNPDLRGEPVVRRNDRPLVLNWRQGNPVPGLPVEGFSARWSGQLIAPVNGDYQLRVVATGGVRVFLAGQAVIDDWTPGTKTHEFRRVFREEETVPIRLEFLQSGGPADIALEWIQPEAGAGFPEALAAAAEADAIVVVGGISAALEGEEMRVNLEGFSGGDRTRIELPTIQVELLKQLQATGKPVIFVLMSGSAVALPWVGDHIPAIVQAWYPGQAGGRALAEVLLGDVNPSGRLPVTFYRSTDDLPAFGDYAMKHRTYRYFEGRALYPFGHGLSYTTFQYGPAHVDVAPSGGPTPFTVRFQVANTGKRDGDEVVQLYVQEPAASPHRSRRSLAAFRRVSLPHGTAREIVLPVSEFALRRWNAATHRYEVTPGEWKILVGASSEDIRETATAVLK